VFKIEEKINIYRSMPPAGGVMSVWYVCGRGTNTEMSPPS